MIQCKSNVYENPGATTTTTTTARVRRRRRESPVSMANKLKHKRNIRHAHLGPQQIVMIVLQLPIREMVPRAPVPIQQRRRLDYLPPIFTPATLERLVRLAQGIFAELEELPKGVDREMSLRILFLVDDSG
jgi:hypothetical protein